MSHACLPTLRAGGDTRPDMQELESTDRAARAPAVAPRRCVVLAGVRRVLVDGREVRLGGRAFDLLLALHACRGHVVPKQDLHDAIWPGLAVMPNNLDVQVWALRRCLGQDAISTVARRGYALTPAIDITVVAAGEGPPECLTAALPGAAPDSGEQQHAALLPLMAGAGRLLLAGADVRARLRLCDAVCQAYRRSVQAAVWRLHAANPPDLQLLQNRVLRLRRVGGLVVLPEVGPQVRAGVYAWARAAAGGRMLCVLATAADADAVVDAGVPVATPQQVDEVLLPEVRDRQSLRWQQRGQAGIG